MSRACYQGRKRLVVGFSLPSMFAIAVSCTSPDGGSSARSMTSQTSDGLQASSSSVSTAAANLPLRPSAPFPGLGANDDRAAAGAQDGPASRSPDTPTPPATESANANSVLSADSPAAAADTLQPAQKDLPVLEGDVERFRYAFFTTDRAGFGVSDPVPYLGVVFTSDPNFCSRGALSAGVVELTMRQFSSDGSRWVDPNTVYNLTVCPEVDWWEYDHLAGPKESDNVGWRGGCFLQACLGGQKSFREANWLVSPLNANDLQSASLVRVQARARNDAQEFARDLTAVRCPQVAIYFRDSSGHYNTEDRLLCGRFEPRSPRVVQDGNVDVGVKSLGP